jgi:hypothetical protein
MTRSIPLNSFTLDFGEALEALKRGFVVARAGWLRKGMSLQLQVPDAHSKMKGAYIYIEAPACAGAPELRVPWVASQTDLLANDWGVR